MANVLILMKFHVHDGYHMIPISMMLSAYFVFLWAESASGEFRDLRYIFANIFDQWMTWLSLAFCTGFIVIQETLYKQYIKYYSGEHNQEYVQLDRAQQKINNQKEIKLSEGYQ